MPGPDAGSAVARERTVHSSIGYQTADGVCYYMGQLLSGKWSLLGSRLAEQRAFSAAIFGLEWPGPCVCEAIGSRFVHTLPVLIAWIVGIRRTPTPPSTARLLHSVRCPRFAASTGILQVAVHDAVTARETGREAQKKTA
eukprot:3768941-Rhodomonas_salina.2